MRLALYRPLREASMEGILWAAKRDSHFLETLRGIRTIKLMNGQDKRRNRWLNLMVETVNRELTAQKLRLTCSVRGRSADRPADHSRDLAGCVEGTG